MIGEISVAKEGNQPFHIPMVDSKHDLFQVTLRHVLYLLKIATYHLLERILHSKFEAELNH